MNRHHHGDQPHERPPHRRWAPADAPAEAVPLPLQLAPPAEVPAPLDGTFAVSQLAERLKLLEANLRAISGQKPWAPPHSDLNLRDRTV